MECWMTCGVARRHEHRPIWGRTLCDAECVTAIANIWGCANIILENLKTKAIHAFQPTLRKIASTFSTSPKVWNGQSKKVEESTKDFWWMVPIELLASSLAIPCGTITIAVLNDSQSRAYLWRTYQESCTETGPSIVSQIKWVSCSKGWGCRLVTKEMGMGRNVFCANDRGWRRHSTTNAMVMAMEGMKIH